jgi:hypothetical protein
MLGVRRTPVTIAARLLQSAGLIRHRRGHIQILDRKALEDIACECYDVVRQKRRQGLYSPAILTRDDSAKTGKSSGELSWHPPTTRAAVTLECAVSEPFMLVLTHLRHKQD